MTSSRHFYKHAGTGIVASLNDDFAAAFGDTFTRVGKSEATEEAKAEAATIEATQVVNTPAAPAETSQKENK